MANPATLKMIRWSVERWNSWRAKNPKINPDYRSKTISNAELVGINLSKMNLELARFVDTNLANADLQYTKGDVTQFFRVNLNGANLSYSKLYNSVFGSSNLNNSTINNADLYQSGFKKIKVEDGDFSQSNFAECRLIHFEISNSTAIDTSFDGCEVSTGRFTQCNLSKTSFKNSRLDDIEFSECILQDVNLSESYLREAIFNNCNLEKAILNNCDLRYSNFSKSDLTGVSLYGAALFGWKINGVKCDYVFFDKDRINRIPRDRNFEPGEFERLYRSVPTLEIVFEQGINFVDQFILEVIAQQAKEKNPALQLELLSLDKKGFYPTAVFGIASEGQRDQAFDYIVEQQQELINTLKSQVQYLEMENISKNNMLLELIKGVSSANPITNVFQPGSRQINQLGENAQYVEHMAIYTEALDGIKQAVNETPEEAFGQRSKKKILEWLEQAPKTLVGEAAKSGVKQLYEYLKAQDLGTLIPRVLPYLDDLQRIVENTMKF